MRTNPRALAVCLLFVAATAWPARAADGPQELAARMNKAAGEFKSMTAHVTYLTHTEVLNEDTTETGTVIMKKVQAGEVQVRIDLTTPDAKTVIVDMRKVQVYVPKIKTLQVFDLDKHGAQFDQFVMIGFGTSGNELAKDYEMKILGTETVPGQEAVPALRLQLIPKVGEAREYVKKLELWIPQQGDPYPLREKITQPSGDYRLVTYTDLKINPPLKPDALQLKLPSGVKTEYPGK